MISTGFESEGAVAVYHSHNRSGNPKCSEQDRGCQVEEEVVVVDDDDRNNSSIE